MLIGELAKQSGASARSIRHYEASGLLQAQRGENGYRDYAPEAVDVVQHIRWLISAGLTVKTIRRILPCVTGGPRALRVTLCAETRALLEGEIQRIDGQLSELRATRKLLSATLASGVPSTTH